MVIGIHTTQCFRVIYKNFSNLIFTLNLEIHDCETPITNIELAIFLKKFPPKNQFYIFHSYLF